MGGRESDGVARLRTAKELSAMTAAANAKFEAHRRLTKALMQLGYDPKADAEMNRKLDEYLKQSKTVT